MRGDAWLTDLGGWLRAYHDAVQGFRVRDAAFSWGPAAPDAGMLVTHGDLGPWNLLHQSGRLSGVIDWDSARYGDPLDDVAELALEAVPLHARLNETLGVVDRETLESRSKPVLHSLRRPLRHRVAARSRVLADGYRRHLQALGGGCRAIRVVC